MGDDHRAFWEHQVRFEGSRAHVDVLLQGREAWNRWRAAHPEDSIRFVNLDLSPEAVRGTRLWEEDHKRASLVRFDLSGMHFEAGSLARADLWRADLRGTTISMVDLCGTRFVVALVDGGTHFYYCDYDRSTDCTGLALGNVQFRAPGDRAYLERNIRQASWERWCEQHAWSGRMAKVFWSISDYGYSTRLLIAWFCLLASLFSIAYWIPGLVDGIHELRADGATVPAPPWLIPVRSMYFSVVTMTTLGFGDIHARQEPTAQAVMGHVLLTTQVLVGYFMLGALVTRLAILFQAAGAPPSHGPGDRPRNLEPSPTLWQAVAAAFK